MHIIVTGGAGFIGSHLLEQLLSAAHRVTVVDNFATGKRHNLPQHANLTLLEKDVLDCGVSDFPEQYDGFVHLAATPSVTQSWVEPVAAHHNNLSATMAAIQLCHRLKIPRLVFASSAAVYGNPSQVPLPEDAATAPISPYGLQKLMGEQYLNLFCQELGFSAVSLRFFNVFGPRQDPRSPYSGVISIFSQAMLEGRPISINGDGTQTRDFIYVKDIAMALGQALTVELEAGSSLVCNLGTGQSISLNQLKGSLAACFPEWGAKTTFAPPRLGDIQDSQADISKARQYLGFEPRYSTQEGLQALCQSLIAADA